jgi:hypothetical protein
MILIEGMEAIGHEAEVPPAAKGNATKSVLRLPDLEYAKASVQYTLASPDAQKRGYRHAIDEFVDCFCS